MQNPEMKLDQNVAKQKLAALLRQNQQMEASLQYNRQMIQRWKNTNIKWGKRNQGRERMNTAAMGVLKNWRVGLEQAEPAIRRRMLLNRAEIILIKQMTWPT